jgi:cell division protein FtsW (lipid II flippase)
LSTDLGSALIFFITYLAMLFVASRKYLYLLIGFAGGCIASILAFYLFSHIQTRVLAWADPWSYIDNKGYQITQSLFAIGTGSWFGMGLYKGVPDDIPFVEVDFIFSSICEEIGAVFGILLVILIISCFMLMIKIALKCNNKFYRLTAFGLSVLYIFQVFLTIGGGIKFIPLTGVTLPLISYGGSSIVSVMIMYFIFLSIHKINQTQIIENDTTCEDDTIIDLDQSQEQEILESEEVFDERVETEQIKTE